MPIERYFAVAFVIIAVSHIVQPQAWVDFFANMRKTGLAGFIIAMYTLPQGLALVIWHNVWAWDWAVVFTICGWGMTIKSVKYLLYPKLADRMIDGPGSKPRAYVAGGVIMLFIGAAMVYVAFIRPV